ncbi:hypothetical protein R3X27_09735 [Tropicimonas sp. TH_r6]|uniref:hypothetical protein n=1 Tax=Tropicimonas sp. TH_r6 TaxID=3082085 RepID=UPI002953CA08|nr:hypothetical protein [Tropicimonas sp. TH_r6]MDV7142966.1 hypothetical protein [Tropicimonas sp. TH_r6]
MDHWETGKRDAEDLALYFSDATGLDEVSVWINVPYTFGADPDTLVFVGAVVNSDGRRGFSAQAEEILVAMGWQLDRYRDIMSEITGCARDLSAHRRLEGADRIRRLREEAVSQDALRELLDRRRSGDFVSLEEGQQITKNEG